MDTFYKILIILMGLTFFVTPILISYKIRKKLLLKGKLVKRFKALNAFLIIFFFILAYKIADGGATKTGSVILDSQIPEISGITRIIAFFAIIIGLIFLGIEIANRKYYKDTNDPDVYEEIDVED